MEQFRFASAIQSEIAYLAGVSASNLIMESNNVTIDAYGNIRVRSS